MPVVRSYQRQIAPERAPTVRREEYRVPHLETPAPAVPQSTEGVARFGATVAQIGEQLYAEEQRKQDQIRLLDAERQGGALENQLMYHPQTGALNVHGQAAMGLPDQVGKAWDAQTDKIRKGLANDRQRLAFDQYNVAKRQSLMDRLSQHVATETYRVDSETLEGIVENETSAAIADGRPKRIKQALDSVEQVYTGYGERYGIAPEQTKAAIAKAKSRIHVGVIDRMLSDGNDIEAKVQYQHVEDQILGEHRGTIERALHEGNLRGDSQRIADSIVNGSIVGMVEKGNLDPFKRPILDNETGEILPPGSDVSNLKNYSTMSTMLDEDDEGKQVLYPSVVDGKRLSPEEAWAHYRKTGEHFGKFDTVEAGERYDRIMHARIQRQTDTGSGQASLGELLDEVALRTEGKPELRERAEARVKAWYADQQEDQRIARERRNEIIRQKIEEEKARKDSEKEKRAQLTDVIVPNLIDAGKPKDVKTFLDAINPKLWASATQKEREEWEKYTKRLWDGDTVKTDFGTYYNLLALSSTADTRDQFARLNLNDPRLLNRISETDLKKLAEIQAEIRKGNDKKADQLTEGFRTTNEMIADSLRVLGLDPTPKDGTDEAKRVGRLRSAVDADIADFEQRTGKKPTKQEIQGFIDQHLIQGTTIYKGLLWDSKEQKFSIDVPEDPPSAITINLVPPLELRQIEDALARRGLPESEAIIIQLYLEKIRGQKKARTKP